MTKGSKTPEDYVRNQRIKSILWGVLTIAGVTVALIFGFRAMFESGDEFRQQTVAKTTVPSKNAGSCVYGTASRVVCKIMSQEACKQNKGLWSRKGTCEVQ